MSNYKENLVKLIKPIFDIYDKEIIPASENQLKDFKELALEKGLPEKTILEFIEFYQVTNGIPCLDSLEIHKINDIILFEWWEYEEIWIGQRDFETLRWKDDKYHLGDTSNLNHGIEYVSDSLIGILQIGINEWYAEDDIYKQ